MDDVTRQKIRQAVKEMAPPSKPGLLENLEWLTFGGFLADPFMSKRQRNLLKRTGKRPTPARALRGTAWAAKPASGEKTAEAIPGDLMNALVSMLAGGGALKGAQKAATGVKALTGLGKGAKAGAAARGAGLGKAVDPRGMLAAQHAGAAKKARSVEKMARKALPAGKGTAQEAGGLKQLLEAAQRSGGATEPTKALSEGGRKAFEAKILGQLFGAAQKPQGATKALPEQGIQRILQQLELMFGAPGTPGGAASVPSPRLLELLRRHLGPSAGSPPPSLLGMPFVGP